MSTYVIIFTMNSSTFLLKLYYYKKPKCSNPNVIEYNSDNETISPVQEYYINSNYIPV